jgi:hypothetical protein
MEILNRREQIKAAAIPPEIANPTTLVTTSDKATKSKAGIVKIGDGIDVSNGVISVPQNSGGTETLYSQPETPDVIGTEITLSAAVSSYKALIVIIDSDDSTAGFSLLLPTTAPFKAVGLNYGGTAAAYTFTVTDGTKIKCTSGTNTHLRWKNVYGLK